MRCDANETCWGNTVLCILRCAFWNRNRFIHILVFFLFFWSVFPFPVLNCPFVPIFGQIKKEREQASHAFYHHHHHTGKGAGREKAGATCAYFWSTWEISGNFFPLLRAGFPLSPNLVVVFLHLRYQTPLFFFCSSPADPHPRAPEAPGSLPTPPPFIPPCQTRSRTRRDEREMGKGGIFIRVVREGRGAGGVGGV